MICKNCGSEYSNGRYCPICGMHGVEEAISAPDASAPLGSAQDNGVSQAAPQEQAEKSPVANEAAAPETPEESKDASVPSGENVVIPVAEAEIEVPVPASPADDAHQPAEEAPQPESNQPQHGPDELVVEVSANEQDDEDGKPARRKKSGRGSQSSGKKIVLWALVCVTLAAAGFFLSMFMQNQYGGWGGFFSSVFGSSSTQTYASPKVEEATVNGEAGHKITIYGPQNAIVSISSLGLKDIITTDSVVFEVADSKMIADQLPDDEGNIEISLEATVVNGAETTTARIPVFSISLMQTPLTLLSPSQTQITTSGTEIKFSVQTVKGAKLTIDGNNISDLVDEEGLASYTLPISWEGEKEVVVEASADGYNTTSIKLTIAHGEDPVKLTIQPALPSSTDKETLLVSGTTDPEATIATTANLDGEIEQNASGTFSFTVKLTYGLNQFQLTSTLSDGTQTVRDIEITRQPDIDTYTRSAQVMDYERIVYNNEKLKGTVFLCVGVITEDVGEQENGAKRFKMDVGSDEIVVIDYFGTADLQEGTSYRIFAHISGMEGSLPLLDGWFAYKR